MKTYFKAMLAFCLVLTCSYTSQAQFKTLPVINLFFKNQFNKEGLHHGRWTFDTEAIGADEVMKTKGRYRHGLMVGKWRTYDAAGKLRKEEKGRVVGKKNYIESIEYHPNGQVAVRGTSVTDRTAEKPRFYREGDWFYYNKDASLYKTVFYTEGWPTKTSFPNGEVIVSEPQKLNARVLKPGEKTEGQSKRGFKVMTDKNNQRIMIEYHENGDSTVKVLPNVQILK